MTGLINRNTAQLFDAFNRCFEIQKNPDRTIDPQVCLVTANVSTPVTALVWDRLNLFKDNGVRVFCVFADLHKRYGSIDAIAQYADIFGANAAESRILQMSTRMGKGIYEQLIVSEGGIWYGDRVTSPVGSELSDGSFVDFHDGRRGFEHMELARRSFTVTFEKGRNLAKTSVWFAPDRRPAPIRSTPEGNASAPVAHTA